MKLVIIEHNNNDRILLQSIIDSWASTNNVTCNVLIFSSGEDFLQANIIPDDIKIFFIDILLDKMSGMDIARLLRDNNYTGAIVFLTQTKDYVFQSYEVHALNYLLKPANPAQISKCLTEVYSEFAQQRYTYRHKGELISIPYNDILCFISSCHNVDIVTLSGSYSQHISFHELKTKLPPDFLQIHRSFIINICHIYKITKNNIILSNQMDLSIGRSYKKNIEETLQHFFHIYKSV